MAACGDDATPAGDTAGGDTTVGDTTVGDTSGGETTPGDTNTPADTTPADTNTPADTTPTDTNTPPDTTPGDTTDTNTPPDTTTGDGAGICLGILSCVSDCTTQQCLESCLGAADNAEEAGFFQGYFTCLQDNDCFPQVAEGAEPTDQQIKDSIACEQQHCLTAIGDCYSGGDSGTATCTDIFSCLNDCADNTDIVCQRACFGAAAEPAVTAWFDLNYCLNIECYGSDDFGACAQQATQNPPCSLKYTACAGDAGAAPGAGGGGGFSPDRHDLDTWRAMHGMRAR